jgi:hypothetical protein
MRWKWKFIFLSFSNLYSSNMIEIIKEDAWTDMQHALEREEMGNLKEIIHLED